MFYKGTFLHKIHGLRLNGGGITLQARIDSWIDDNEELYLKNSQSLTNLSLKKDLTPKQAQQIRDKIEYDKKAHIKKLKD